jgi:hypothetical protein
VDLGCDCVKRSLELVEAIADRRADVQDRGGDGECVDARGLGLFAL